MQKIKRAGFAALRGLALLAIPAISLASHTVPDEPLTFIYEVTPGSTFTDLITGDTTDVFGKFSSTVQEGGDGATFVSVSNISVNIPSAIPSDALPMLYDGMTFNSPLNNPNVSGGFGFSGGEPTGSGSAYWDDLSAM